jgi:hypothetical protein
MGFPVLRPIPLYTHAGAITPAEPLNAVARPVQRRRSSRSENPVDIRITLFEACSTFTHVAACTLALSPNFATRFTGGFNRFVTSTVAPVASGWSGCRVGFAPTGKAPP